MARRLRLRRWLAGVLAESWLGGGEKQEIGGGLSTALALMCRVPWPSGTRSALIMHRRRLVDHLRDKQGPFHPGIKTNNRRNIRIDQSDKRSRAELTSAFGSRRPSGARITQVYEAEASDFPAATWMWEDEPPNLLPRVHYAPAKAEMCGCAGQVAGSP